jgi:predicted N-acyltransferase
VFGAIADSRLCGFALFVDDGHWWNAFVVARRDPVADRDVYFELMYHTPIEHAAARGIAEISFGYGTEEAKRRRGCTLVRVPAWFHSTEPAVRRWLADTAREERSNVVSTTAVPG